MRTQKTTVRHARGIVVGCADAGKTTLLYSLMGKRLEEMKKIKSTRGLQVYEHIFSVKDESLIATENLSRNPLIRVPKSSLTVKNDLIEDSPQDMAVNTENETGELGVGKEGTVKPPVNPPYISEDRSNSVSSNALVAGTLSPEVIEKILDAQENEISVSMIDFAGQFAYYACHQIYMRSDAFYILVLDMTKNFEDVSGNQEQQPRSVFSTWTYKRYIEFWLDSIKLFSGPEAPVLIVITHAEGKTEDDIEKFFEGLWRLLPREDRLWLSEFSSKEEDEFAFGLIEMNEKEKLQDLQSLKNAIVDIVSDKLNTKIPVPSSWALLEHLLKDTGKPIISFDEIQELNKKLPEEYRLESNKEVPHFLSFFHSHGLFLYFHGEATRTHVILGIQWFSNAFSKLIADKKHINKDCRRQHLEEWEHFNQTGELYSTLVDALWKDEKSDIHNTVSFIRYKNELMAYMERLRMLVTIGDIDNATSWYVPCMNKKEFDQNIIKPNSEGSSILCFRFISFAMFVFYRLVAYCMSSLKWNVASDEDGKCLFQTAAVFEYKNHTVMLRIFNKDIQLQVIVEPSSLVIDTDVSCEIGSLIHNALNELTKIFSEKTNGGFQRGYKCQEMSFIPEEELCRLNNDIQCPCCPLGRKHPVDVYETRRFWEKMRTSDFCFAMASVADLSDRSRFAKLGMATNDVLSQACRDILELEIHPSHIFNKVKASPVFKRMRPEQEHLLLDSKNSGYQNFDISLTYTLIRNVCSKIPKPSKGKWGEEPETGDITVGDDIERIRSIRNSLTAHVCSASTSQTEFDNTWLLISDICQRLETFLGKKYLDKIYFIQKLTLKEEDEDAIIEKVKEECEREKSQKDMLHSLLSDMQDIKMILKPEGKEAPNHDSYS
ncbi:probable serine/threonine-protein kinase pats1 [Saccostrea cucullata]|uniref:probable serine/threonine-protein kinase pats1 n=1 Tax=Saccostrea cuccullata TaxID=36930 RepID=UPI002ECFCE05